MPNIPTQMQAVTINEFGDLDKLTLQTVPVPELGEGEVLIRVEVAGLGPWDTLEREGTLILGDVSFPRVLGGEGAGTIAAVGEGVQRFADGERVYAQVFMNPKGGAFAQYVVVPESLVALVPDALSIEAAGGLPIAGATALSNLNALAIKPGDTLMLWGASGGVGHVALQLAKRLGARVFAIASGADGVELCQELGADDAVDGRGADLRERARAFAPNGFDKALILTGGNAYQPTLELVRKGGIIAFPNGVLPEPVAPDGVELQKANGFANEPLLKQLNDLIEQGKFKVHIAQTFPFEAVAPAQAAMEGHYLGKIVLHVG